MLRKIFSIAILLAFTITITRAQNSKTQWRIQPVTIQTRWAKNVNPNNPLPEYPRPQMVRENNWQNLNGIWDITITSKDAPIPSIFQRKILVPYPLESGLSGVKMPLKSNEILWYHRTFEAKVKKGKKILLHFGAVDWEATIYVNGKIIGTHTGGYTEFSFDITEAVNLGSNELLVKVLDPTEQGIGPHGKQVLNPSNIYYTASSGIWQTVWLETVPTDYIQNLSITPDIDKGTITINVKGPSAYDVQLITTASGKLVGTAQGIVGDAITLSIKDAKLWSPDSPFLYDLKVRLLKNGKKVDEVKSYFGMRKISIAKDDKGVDRIFLNNKYYYNLGTLDQGFWPDGLYTAPTDSALQFDIWVIKAMGFNTIRKHIKVEPARWYYHADKMGILVWQDMVNPNQNLPEGSKIEFEKECTEILNQLHNYPSIVTWVLFNEKWGQYDQERLTKWIKQTDSSRLINGHSGEFLYVNNELRSPSSNAYIHADMTDVHSYPFPMLSIKQPGKAQVLGEFGGIGVPIEGHLWDDLVSGWGYDGVVTPTLMQKKYAQMIDSLKVLETKGLSASIYTQPFDVESEQNGIMTYDREIIKLPIDKLRIMNALIWPTTANYSLLVNRFSTRIADSIPQPYLTRLNEYKSGRRDSAFLRNFSIIALQNKDSILASLTASDYILKIKDPFNESNLKYIRRFTTKTNDPGFNIFFSNREKINQKLGNNLAELFIMNVIYQDKIAPQLSGSEVNWDRIEQDILPKFGELGQEELWLTKVLYYLERKDWNNYGKYYKLYFDKVLPVNRNILHINNMSWPIFENINDSSILETAVRAMAYAIDKYDSLQPNSLDTYANLLYKTGHKEEALRWERKAIVISNNREIFKNTYDKMQNGQKTWK